MTLSLDHAHTGTTPNQAQHHLPIAAPGQSIVLTPANRDSWCILENWRKWPDAQMALIGPAASGKSLLCTAWSEQSGAAFIAGSALADMSAHDIHARLGRGLVIDDADLPDCAGGLLAAFNLCRKRREYLLLSGSKRPTLWPIVIRDLQSRLDALPITELGPACDLTLDLHLGAACRSRFMKLPTATARHLVRHMPRKYENIAPLVAAMSDIAAGRPLSIAVAREALRSV